MKNPNSQKLIMELKKEASVNKVSLWKRVAADLERPTRLKRVVNLAKIDKYTSNNDTIVVPGKVLASGELSKKVTIAAVEFSNSALEKIKNSGSTAFLMEDFLKKNPKPKNIKLIG